MILIDANIPMYLVGGAHLRKADAQRLPEDLVRPLLNPHGFVGVLQPAEG